jgi:hypothetical protein
MAAGGVSRPSVGRWAAFFDAGRVCVEVDVRVLDVDETVTATGTPRATATRVERLLRRLAPRWVARRLAVRQARLDARLAPQLLDSPVTDPVADPRMRVDRRDLRPALALVRQRIDRYGRPLPMPEREPATPVPAIRWVSSPYWNRSRR